MAKRLFDEVTTETKTEGWVVSASQIKTWVACPRKWGFEYIKGLRSPSTAATLLGSAVHKILEDYFTGVGDPYDGPGGKAQTLAQAVIDSGALPSPGFFIEPENVERPFLLRTGDLKIRGFIDLVVPKARTPLVADHKTSSNPDLYGLTPETLATDIQATIYAAAALDTLGVDVVECQWTYITTRGPAKVTPVRATLDRETVRENLEAHVLPPTREILETITRHAQREVDPIDLRPVPGSCGDFGGCPHSDYCPRERADLLTAAGWNEDPQPTESEEDMSLIEMLKAKKAAQATEPQTEDPAPEPKATKAPKAKKLAPPRINSPEHEAIKKDKPTDEPDRAPQKEDQIEISRRELLARPWPIVVAKSRKKASADRPFVKLADLRSLEEDKIAQVEDHEGGRRVDHYVCPTDEAPDTTPIPTPTEPESDPEPEPEPEPESAPSTEAPLGRRLVALYMRKDGKIIVEIDPEAVTR